MPEAQPGQEQRMVTNAMIEAGERRYADWGGGHPPVGKVATIYTAMEAARPTAELGEDGDLVERVIAGSLTFRNGNPMQDGDLATAKSEDLRALCDRLILYREALGDAFGTLHYIYETTDDDHEKRAAAEARDKIDALLSRSGG